jgi:hypothetical protein
MARVVASKAKQAAARTAANELRRVNNERLGRNCGTCAKLFDISSWCVMMRRRCDTCHYWERKDGD